MNSEAAVGRKIIRVEQQRKNIRQTGRVVVTDVTAIVLDNGTKLVPIVRETDFGYYAVEIEVIAMGA